MSSTIVDSWTNSCHRLGKRLRKGSCSVCEEAPGAEPNFVLGSSIRASGFLRRHGEVIGVPLRRMESVTGLLPFCCRYKIMDGKECNWCRPPPQFHLRTFRPAFAPGNAGSTMATFIGGSAQPASTQRRGRRSRPDSPEISETATFLFAGHPTVPPTIGNGMVQVHDRLFDGPVPRLDFRRHRSGQCDRLAANRPWRPPNWARRSPRRPGC